MPRTNRWIRVEDSQIHGSGVYAARPIPKGTRIIRYRGKLLTKKQSERISDREDRTGRIYLFEIDDRYDLDGNVPENDARFINHSCEPNCESVLDGRKIWIEAMRDIERGEELSYDYCFDAEDMERHPCRCGSRQCRGYILKGED